MTTSTLASLALLKVNADHGKDYLEYLRPFILQILFEHKPDPVTNENVKKHIRDQFGLEIPERTIELVLRRISKENLIQREHAIYRIVGNLPNPELTAKRNNSALRINAVLSGLCNFSQDTVKPIDDKEDAIVSICAFLAEFDITCLRAYRQSTAIPPLEGEHATDIVLISDYVQHIQESDQLLFESFIVLVQGHMLANALMCPDLAQVPDTYQNVTFYLDAPLLVQSLGADGEAQETAVKELIALLRRLKGKVATFSHSRDESQRVLEVAAEKLNMADGRGSIVFEARRRKTTRSDLLLLAESIDDKLSEANIEVVKTPRYVERYQIDERVFEHVLDDGLSYRNPRAKQYDINSVRSIYALRRNTSASSIERSCAVLVTNNAAFANAAWEYGQQHEASQDVSSVITNFSLANMAWLKVPMEAPSIPTTQVLAFSYAALEPSNELLDKCIEEIDRLMEKGGITARDHQLLRSSPRIYDELMHFTLGEDSALTDKTIAQACEQVSNEIREEEYQKFDQERKAHQKTRNALSSQQIRNQKIVENLCQQSQKWAKMLAWSVTIIIGVILLLGLFSGIGLHATSPTFAWMLIGGSTLLAGLMLINLTHGFTLKSLHERVYSWCLGRLIERYARITEIDIEEFHQRL
ncbi:MAG: hypothetical protein OXL96_11525 [Candidatus Poribacteria bacterium]|nr:hypothetical protein [Candidatus Poribacteria bacterium]